jgi:tryptophan-rich sensory protein
VTLIFFLILCHGCGHMSTRLARPSMGPWFSHLKKPAWHPPSWVFARVWLLLYTLMALAGWRLAENYPPGLSLWALQLALNQAWTYLFFVRRSPGLALIDNFCLWTTLGLCVATFWPADRWASLLMVPEWLWIGFAITVNYATWKLNRPQAA